jgi:hypothetical protein
VERVRDEVEPAVGVSAVESVEVLGVEVAEEERRASPDPGDSVKPPPRQAQDPVPVAIGLSRAAAHEDEPRRRGSGDGGSLVVLLVPAQAPARRQGDGMGR